MAHKVGADTEETVVSLLLIDEFNTSHPIPGELWIGWEELMRVPINPAHYIWLSILEMGNVKPTNHNKLDLAMNNDKSMSVLSCTVLAEMLASKYKYINPDLDALLLQASQQFVSTTTDNNSKGD